MSGQPFPQQRPENLARPRRRRVPQWVRIAVSIVIGVILFLFGLFTSVMALTSNTWAFADGIISNTGMLAVLLLVPVWGTVFLRHKWPWAPFIAGALLTIGWGDALLLLIGLFHLVIRASKRQAIVASAAASVLVIASTVRMCLSPVQLNPFAIMFLPDPEQMTNLDAPAPPADALLAITLVTIAAAIIGLGTSLGVGSLLRRTKRMKAVETIAARETQRNDSLSAQIARQSERELLARELHDTLSHRLSVISLHSGALEVGGKDDPGVASTASALRQEAHASLEDLRHLVGGVREGTLANPSPLKEASTPPSLTSMRSIPQLVASVQSTGTIIRPSIIIQDVESASTVLDRAVYRIVQESLTNAMKHAPGAPVTLGVTVSADLGARVVIANPAPPTAQRLQHPRSISAEAGPGIPPYPTSAPRVGPTNPGAQQSLSSTGAGAGLVGIRERVAMLDGEVFIGVRDGSFVVEVTLPPFERQG
ncbi:sensor histidine kinase [Brevibacterium sandarakinum]|uniref:sensor histidine kinase n=1 Tax=Brevibacterium sandarakinum TaxID=629680 RepID=UPI001E40AF6A|nr:histidine kinase [Brevibacterium sandarakinum]